MRGARFGRSSPNPRIFGGSDTLHRPHVAEALSYRRLAIGG